MLALLLQCVGRRRLLNADSSRMADGRSAPSGRSDREKSRFNL
jgi:hypothetical protein